MKKTISILLICAVILSATACANTRRFDSENALMEHLDGMWVVDDTRDDKTYYIFRDGKIYCFNDVQFSYRIEHFFDSFISDGNLAALNKLDYNATISGMGIEEILGNVEENVVIQPSKGKIIIDEGKTYEKQIIITKNAVAVKEADEKASNALNRLSDEADFNGEHFEAIFEETIESHTVPTAQFWMDTKEYGNIVKSFNRQVDGWDLTTKDEDTTIYESSKWVPSVSGALIITDKDVTFTEKVSLTSNWNPHFMILYTPQNRKIQISDIDNTALSLMSLLQYGAIAVQNFPGALDHTKLYDMYVEECEKGNTTIKNGANTFEKTIMGITYKIQVGTDETWAIVSITANEKISLSSIIQSIQESTQICSQCKESFSNEYFSSGTTVCDICTYQSNNGSSGDTDSSDDVGSSGNAGSSGSASSGSTGSSDNLGSSNSSGSPGGVASCSHSYAAATCTKPKTCTKCGATTGSTTEHTWKNTSCTTPKACSVCGQELVGSVPGHQWKNATCTQPETCAACKSTQGNALGHDVQLTKCSSCDYTDYSAIAKTYPNITAYDGRSGEDLEVTSVSVNNSGVLSFTFNGKSYSITIKQKAYDSMTYFDCYLDGKLLKNATCRVGDASYYNMLHFEWDGVDGHNLYFNTERQ